MTRAVTRTGARVGSNHSWPKVLRRWYRALANVPGVRVVSPGPWQGEVTAARPRVRKVEAMPGGLVIRVQIGHSVQRVRVLCENETEVRTWLATQG